VPRPAAGTLNAAYKITKRRDEDISAVACGFHVALKDGTVETARLAFGGMAATPKRAAGAEAALVGQPWTLATVVRAEAALAVDFQPITDWRASADYRALAARNLLRRFYLESTGEPVRLAREVAV
jgi:xanthine dehydrogenase small subunit